ncbi:MAG TPA: hypothetical protein VF718_02655 [Allosphingosinicella sp.]|jgi:hypothetical protein
MAPTNGLEPFDASHLVSGQAGKRVRTRPDGPAAYLELNSS